MRAVTRTISLYDAAADWNGGLMTESAYSSIRGAEISERSSELVLPSRGATDVSALNSATHSSSASLANGLAGTSLGGVAAGAAPSVLDEDSSSLPTGVSHAAIPDSSIAASPLEGAASLGTNGGPVANSPASDRGRALPGDRGARDFGAATGARPSFWRRIALGRRSQALRAAQQAEAAAPERAEDQAADLATARGQRERGPSLRSVAAESRIARAEAAVAARESLVLDSREIARATEGVERRIVEPLLQALVSVEAKLERSHVDLVGRSDQVEQRLTQLWDIEEQLGALGELQESVLQVTEQQRRLESALVAQTRIMRWLVGGIILSLAVAAFCVAFFLRVAR